MDFSLPLLVERGRGCGRLEGKRIILRLYAVQLLRLRLTGGMEENFRKFRLTRGIINIIKD
jgi:hypothetical protein